MPIATGAPQQTASLFDHLVGADEQGRRHGKAERLGSLEVDGQLEFGRLLAQEYKKAARLGAAFSAVRRLPTPEPVVMMAGPAPVMPSPGVFATLTAAFGPIPATLPAWGDLVLPARLCGGCWGSGCWGSRCWGGGCWGGGRSSRSVGTWALGFRILGECRRAEQQSTRCNTKQNPIHLCFLGV